MITMDCRLEGVPVMNCLEKVGADNGRLDSTDGRIMSLREEAIMD